MFDLHTHLGGAVPASVLWEILCDSGLQTDFETFDALQAYLTVERSALKDLDSFLGKYFHVTELIQSSPSAASVAAYQAVAKAYRRSHLEGMEVRYNPLKRVRGGLHTLDAIILATIQGLQRASTHYPVKTGILFSMGKELSLANNTKIVEAAIRFRRQGGLGQAAGVVGIDMAGPESKGRDLNLRWLKSVAKLTEEARSAGLGITWHVGETGDTGPTGLENVIEIIRPQRIGHGIQLRKARGKQKKRLYSMILEADICFEICPSVNLVTRSINDLKEIADLIRDLDMAGIAYCINTDNPYLIHTNLEREYKLMAEALGPDKGILENAHAHARRVSFS